MIKATGKLRASIKKMLFSLVLASAFVAQPASADAIDVPYLTNITNYTFAILQAVNNIPIYLQAIATMAVSFSASDSSSQDPIDWSSSWGNEANWMGALATANVMTDTEQLIMQGNLLTNFFGSKNISAATPFPLNINDLSYLTLLGQPLVTQDSRQGVDAATNYLLNASSLSAPLPPPSAGWRGDADSLKNYVNYYNIMTSVQTYNAYVLSRLYLDSKNQSGATKVRAQLINQSTNSAWFSAVTGNDLGWVLRQLLLYTSQSYVLLDQLVQTQKQMSATLAMTNSLFIVSNQLTGNFLMKKAMGSAASSS